MQNHTIREMQNNDGCSKEQLIQDASSKAVLDVYQDSTYAVSLDTQRSLQATIGPRNSDVYFHLGDGRNTHMSYTQARNGSRMSNKNAQVTLAGAKGSMMRRQRKKSTTNVPPDSNFASNKNGTYSAPPVPNDSNH